MKDRFLVLDEYHALVSAHTTEAAAEKYAREEAGYDGGSETKYYVAVVVGEASTLTTPPPVKYTKFATKKATKK